MHGNAERTELMVAGRNGVDGSGRSEAYCAIRGVLLSWANNNGLGRVVGLLGLG